MHNEVDLKLIFFNQFNNCGILVNCQKYYWSIFSPIILVDSLDKALHSRLVFFSQMPKIEFQSWNLFEQCPLVRGCECEKSGFLITKSPLLLLPKFSQQSSMIPDTGYRLFFLYSKDWKCSNPVLVNFRNDFYHTLPAPEFWFQNFSIPFLLLNVGSGFASYPFCSQTLKNVFRAQQRDVIKSKLE